MPSSADRIQGDCVFCNIIAGTEPAAEVYSDDMVYAFRDIRPIAPTHVLVIPRRHIPRIIDADGEEAALMARMFHVAHEVARQEGLADDGYRCVINCGHHGLQTIYHLHLHVIGGRPMKWPPG